MFQICQKLERGFCRAVANYWFDVGENVINQSRPRKHGQGNSNAWACGSHKNDAFSDSVEFLAKTKKGSGGGRQGGGDGESR